MVTRDSSEASFKLSQNEAESVAGSDNLLLLDAKKFVHLKQAATCNNSLVTHQMHSVFEHRLAAVLEPCQWQGPARVRLFQLLF